MKLKVVIPVVVIFALLCAGIGYKMHAVIEYKKKLSIKLPNGKIVSVRKAPKITEEDKQHRASLRGKIETVRESVLKDDTDTRLVLIANNGEMILLVNPDKTNILRTAFVGREIILRGYWYGKTVFRGRSYRSLWVEQILLAADKKGSRQRTAAVAGSHARK